MSTNQNKAYVNSLLSSCELHSDHLENAQVLSRGLHENVRLTLRALPTLANRLDSMPIVSNGIGLRAINDFQQPSEDIESYTTDKETFTRASTPYSAASTELNVRKSAAGAQSSYDIVLSESRVYRRVQCLEIDALTTASTTGSRSWSVLSGYSLADLSVVSVFHLPLSDEELSNFRALTLPIYPNNVYDEYFRMMAKDSEDEEIYERLYGYRECMFTVEIATSVAKESIEKELERASLDTGGLFLIENYSVGPHNGNLVC